MENRYKLYSMASKRDLKNWILDMKLDGLGQVALDCFTEEELSDLYGKMDLMTDSQLITWVERGAE